ncbi:MAG: efflux RND transporter permease subunit [Desulfurivibrionaceae bacterium]
MQKYIKFIFHYPRTLLALILIVSIGCGFLYSRLPVETSVESLIIEDDPDLHFYNKFKQEFGEDEFVVIGFKQEDLFSAPILRAIESLTEQLENIDEVKEVVSLTNVEHIQGTDSNFIVRPLIGDIPEDTEALESIKIQALANPLINQNIVFQKGKAAIFLLRTKAHSGDEAYDSRLLQKIKDVLADQKTMGKDSFHLASWVVTDVNMSGFMNEDMALFMPLTYLMIVILLLVFLRRVVPMIISIITVSFCLLWTMAALYLVGGAMSPMTSILSPLIMALAVSDSIHLFSDFLKQDRTNQPVTFVMQNTLKRLWAPCFLTSLTTAIGFASLSLSEIPPIRHFGLAAASGMLIEFVLTMSLIPVGIYFFRNSRSLKAPFKSPDSILDRSIARLGDAIPRIRYVVCILSFLMVIAAVIGATRVEVETDLINYFRQDTKVYKDARFVDRELGGVNTLEVSLQGKDVDSFLSPAKLKVMEKIVDYLGKQEAVTKIMSMTTFLKQMNKSFHNEDPDYFRIPDSRQMIAQYLFIYGGDEMFNFVNQDYNWARISARVTEHNSRQLQTLIRDLENFVHKQFPDTDLDIRVTGKTFLVNKLLDRIVESQISTLATAFVIIFLVLFVVFRSFKLGLLSLIPNSLPILFNLGVMGFMGIPLNTATAIIAAVAIGIAVDDTIHYLIQYQRERGGGKGVGEAALRAMRIKGVPICTTSLILVGGFGILVFSHFVPTVQFGFLSALIMIFALVSDILILPSILILGRKRQ